MKIVSVFILVCSLQVTANVYAQTKKFDITLKNTSVKEVLKTIESQSDYRFFYNDELSDLTRIVTVDLKDMPIELVLSSLFNQSKVTYKVLENNLIIISPSGLMTQQQEIKGKVTSASTGEALTGVNIVIKGTLTGTVTDIDGNFSLKVAGTNTILVFSFIGYTPREITVVDNSPINVALEEAVTGLDEVVVVGYGTMKKSDLTGSVSSVKMKAITDIPSNSIDRLLQGRAAGLQVMNTSQDPGAGSIIRIRGNSSLRGSNTPLIVVNGFPLGDAGNLSQINPANIETIEILKDASASAIYGSRGANGVILVTTKSAKEGKTNVAIKHQTVISQLTEKLDIWYDPMLMAQVANEEQINAGLTPPYIGQTIGGIYYPSLLEIQSGNWSNTDWVDLTLRTPVINNSTVSVNSAGEQASFNMNVNYFNDQGMYKKDSYNKLNADIGLTYKLFKNITLSTYNILSLGNRNISNGLQYGRNPLWPVYDENGDYFTAGPQDFGHPLIALEDITNKYADKEFVNSFAADWELIKGLKLHSQINYRHKTTVGDVYRASTTSQDANNNRGIGQVNTTIFQSLLTETYLTYTRNFGEAHALTAMAGHSYGFDNNRGLYTTARGFINDVLENENMNASDPAKRDIYNDGFYISKLLSFYGRANYSLLSKYLFTFTMRADGSTKFGKNNKWGYFPSGALSWKMHLEPWLRDVEWLSELKVRASYGISGNQGISSYQTLDRYGMEKFWNNGQWKTIIGPGYEVGRTGANDRYFVWGGIMNPDLKWETTGQLNIGADMAFFSNRLRTTFDVYSKRTTDLLREKYLPLSSSYDKLWVNEGEVTNKGFEISVDGDIISKEEWGFSAMLIYSMNRNKVVNLGDIVSSGLSIDYLTSMPYEVTGPSLSMFNQNASVYGVNQPMNVFYGYKTNGIIQIGEDPGFIDADGIKDRPGEIKYVDLTDDYTITPADRTIIGDPSPDFTASLNLSARWKKFDLSVFLYGVYGNDVLYNNYTFSPRVKAKRWTPDNPTNDFPRLNNNRQYWLSDYFIQDGSFLRIQNVNLRYNFDVKESFITNIRLFINLENLYTFTKFDGYDPEVGLDGIYWGGFPKFRKYSLGLDISF